MTSLKAEEILFVFLIVGRGLICPPHVIALTIQAQQHKNNLPFNVYAINRKGCPAGKMLRRF